MPHTMWMVDTPKIHIFNVREFVVKDMYARACKGCDGGYVGMWTHCAESGSFPSMLR